MTPVRAGSRLAWTTLLLACVCFAVHAQRLPVPTMTDEQISELLEGDATLESRLDADLDGDGEIDTVFVAQDSRSRHAVAMLAYRDATGAGHRRIGMLRLDSPPLVRARMRMDGRVLAIEDLTGSGDTATQAAYRFRFDRKAGGLRLVGLDAARYSRKRRHDAVRLNWDPASGRQVLAYGTPSRSEGSEAGYHYGAPKRSTRKSPALSMDATPTADEALWRAGVRLGQSSE
jgi:hypothetical protein